MKKYWSKSSEKVVCLLTRQMQSGTSTMTLIDLNPLLFRVGLWLSHSLHYQTV